MVKVFNAKKNVIMYIDMWFIHTMNLFYLFIFRRCILNLNVIYNLQILNLQ